MCLRHYDEAPNPHEKSLAKVLAERLAKDIPRHTRRHFSADDNIRIVLDGRPGEDGIAELWRKEAITQSLDYAWSKELNLWPQ